MRNAIGMVTLVLGVIGVFLPFIPGIPLLVVSYLLLSRGDRHWRRRVQRLPDDALEDLRFRERMQLKVLRGTSKVLNRLERLERRRVG